MNIKNEIIYCPFQNRQEHDEVLYCLGHMDGNIPVLRHLTAKECAEESFKSYCKLLGIEKESKVFWENPQGQELRVVTFRIPVKREQEIRQLLQSTEPSGGGNNTPGRKRKNVWDCKVHLTQNQCDILDSLNLDSRYAGIKYLIDEYGNNAQRGRK